MRPARARRSTAEDDLADHRAGLRQPYGFGDLGERDARGDLGAQFTGGEEGEERARRKPRRPAVTRRPV
ncbi:hypothetical protein GCM10010240_62150 [Streptomyces griseoviridis]|nr:hypothetical protein GCM10010240_62150 [Streptomyces griseoviridis]